MSRGGKIIILIAIAVLIAVMALFPTIRRALSSGSDTEAHSSSGMQQRSLQVNARVLGYQVLDDMFLTKGVLIPDEEVDLSFETSGKITEILFKEGAAVRKGELLAKVNDRTLLAELRKLEAQVPLAEARVQRQQTLLEKDAVSQESYESVVTDLDKLRADIDLVKARIALTELRAPFDGMVGLRQVSEGAYASPTVIVTKLTKITPLKIEFSVNEKQAADIVAGTPLTFTIDNNPNQHNATVYAVESRLDRTTLTLIARARYDNPGGRLRPGLSASININLHRFDSALVIPSMATVAELGRDIAYLYKDGVAREVEIKKGIRTATSIQVLGGLSPADTLITTGVMQLRDGMKVVINKME